MKYSPTTNVRVVKFNDNKEKSVTVFQKGEGYELSAIPKDLRHRFNPFIEKSKK